MTSDRRTWTMGVLVWVAVVLVGSSLVWVVISHAGAGVAPQPGAPVAAGDAETDAAQRTSPDSSATERATLRPHPTATRPDSPSSPEVPSATRSTSSAGPEPEPGEQPGSGSTQTPASPPANGASAARRTWSGTGGSVVAECTGNRIRLVAAQPDGGFAVEVDNRGPEELEVAFEGRGDEERESEVHAVCVGGAPRFAAESHGED